MVKKYSWETIFRPNEDLMIHTLTDRVKIYSNTKTGIVKVLKDGEVISIIENPAILEYEKFLTKVAEDANLLDEFNEQ